MQPTSSYNALCKLDLSSGEAKASSCWWGLCVTTPGVGFCSTSSRLVLRGARWPAVHSRCHALSSPLDITYDQFCWGCHPAPAHHSSAHARTHPTRPTPTHPTAPAWSLQTWHEPGAACWEPVFAPRPGAVAEDDGVLLSILTQPDSCSALLVLDGASLEEVGRVVLPYGLPAGFHALGAAGSCRVGVIACCWLRRLACVCGGGGGARGEGAFRCSVVQGRRVG